jgi:hypothetical protein
MNFLNEKLHLTFWHLLQKLKKDESESSLHLVASTSILLETTCSESNEDLTSKVANIEKLNSFKSQ